MFSFLIFGNFRCIKQATMENNNTAKNLKNETTAKKTFQSDRWGSWMDRFEKVRGQDQGCPV